MRRIRHDLIDDSIDKDVLKRLHEMGGDELVTGLIDLYLKGAPVKMDAIFDGLKTASCEPIERAAHTMISSAGNLGGKLVSDLAKKIEAASLEENLEEIEHLAGQLYQANAIFNIYLKEYAGTP